MHILIHNENNNDTNIIMSSSASYDTYKELNDFMTPEEQPCE